MFIPTKYRYKKQQKGKKFTKIESKLKGIYHNINTICLKATEYGRLTSNHFKTLKLIVTKKIKKIGRLVIKKFPQTPISKKPIEIRMGKGKGNIDHWVSKIKPGSILCYIESNTITKCKQALLNVQYKLPFKTKIIY